MKYCIECGTQLVEKECNGEGKIPYCNHCNQFRFPQFNVAVSMEVLNPQKDKVLLIQQYGKQNNILVAGYVNKGENSEAAVVREVKEEIGLDVVEYQFMKSEFFEPSNTLMLNYMCVVEKEDLTGVTEEVDKAQWFSIEEAVEHILPNSLAEKFLLNFIEYRKKK